MANLNERPALSSRGPSGSKTRMSQRMLEEKSLRRSERRMSLRCAPRSRIFWIRTLSSTRFGFSFFVHIPSYNYTLQDTEKRKGLFLNALFQELINQMWFTDKNDEGIEYSQYFNPISNVLIALVTTVVSPDIFSHAAPLTPCNCRLKTSWTGGSVANKCISSLQRRRTQPNLRHTLQH